MSKQLKLTIGGKERTLDVGKYGFTRYFGEVTKSDPLNLSEVFLRPDQEFEFAVAVIYAGLKTHCDVEKSQVDFTKEDIQGWLTAMEKEEVEVFLTEYFLMVNAKKVEPGEAPAQAVKVSD